MKKIITKKACNISAEILYSDALYAHYDFEKGSYSGEVLISSLAIEKVVNEDGTIAIATAKRIIAIAAEYELYNNDPDYNFIISSCNGDIFLNGNMSKIKQELGKYKAFVESLKGERIIKVEFSF